MGDEVKKTEVKGETEVKPYVAPQKKDEPAVSKSREYRSKSNKPVTIGFADRTVTWEPYGIQKLSAGEFASAEFKKRINDFREVK